MRKLDDLEKKNFLCVKENLCFVVFEVKVDDLYIDYLIVLGFGVFGIVYKGKWVGLVVVVKVFIVIKRNWSIMFDMVEKEINISFRICYLNIVLFLVVVRVLIIIYFVYEYIDGCNIWKMLFLIKK